MDQLRGRLEFKDVQINVDLQTNEQDGKAIAAFDTPLTPDVAYRLGCREMFFDSKDVAREFTGTPGVPIILKDLELIFTEPGEDTFKMRPDLVHCFKIGREKAGGETSITLNLSFRAHFTREDHLDRIYAFWKNHRTKEPFSLTIDPDQQELPFQGGERVGLSDGTKQNGTPETPFDGDEPGPALASAREAVGGTHARKRRGPEAVN